MSVPLKTSVNPSLDVKGSEVMISFTVYGIPQTAGSKRAFPFHRKNGKLGVAVSDDNPRSRDWKNAVASQARLSCCERDLLTVPLIVCLNFVLPRPKGHFGSGRNADRLRDSSPVFPAVKPDVLKLARAVEDALTGVVWRDDSQIVVEILSKKYGPIACVDIRIDAAVDIEVMAARLQALNT